MVKNNFIPHNDNLVYVIAEIGINHNGKLQEAIDLVNAAKRAGANAVKFQTYNTDLRTKKNSPIYDILKNCELGKDDFKELKDLCDSLDIEFFSTPFDEESINILENLNVKTYKIASFDVSNKDLVGLVSKTKKKIIFSTGMASLSEIDEIYNLLIHNTDNIGILHCISSYPTPENACRLENIQSLKTIYPEATIGYSDHTSGIYVPVTSVACGARIIEKHFCLDEHHVCVDKPVSIGENDFTNMVNQIRNLEKILGQSKFGIRDEEKEIVQYRRVS